jgi:hypothetical protein
LITTFYPASYDLVVMFLRLLLLLFLVFWTFCFSVYRLITYLDDLIIIGFLKIQYQVVINLTGYQKINKQLDNQVKTQELANTGINFWIYLLGLPTWSCYWVIDWLLTFVTPGIEISTKLVLLHVPTRLVLVQGWCCFRSYQLHSFIQGTCLHTRPTLVCIVVFSWAWNKWFGEPCAACWESIFSTGSLSGKAVVVWVTTCEFLLCW